VLPPEDEPLVWRFVVAEQTAISPDGSRRAASSAFRHKNGFSIWFAAGSDMAYLRQHFARAGVIELRVSDLIGAGFSVERCPADGGLIGDHADVIPPTEWTHSELLKASRALSSLGRLIIEPPPNAST
jgi:hypothetical protein